MDLIAEFLDKKLITNYNTKKLYRCYIKKYFRVINKDISKSYFKQKPEEIEKDLETAFLYFKTEENVSLNVIKTIFNAVKQFLFKMDKCTKTLEFWDTLKDRTRNASTMIDDDTPNRQDIKKILQHGNTRARAMFLIQACTGCRIGELVALFPEDIHLDENPVRVNFTRSYDVSKPTRTKLFTKNKNKHDGFLTQEAVESYEAYMKEREALFKRAIRVMPKRYRPVKITGNKKLDNKNINEYVQQERRIFPYSDNTVRLIWSNIIKKTDLFRKDSNTNRLTLHPHCLRKFFRSYLGNVDLAEHLMGHGGYLTSYRDMKKEDLGKHFLKYAQNVTIFGGTIDSERLNGLQDQLLEKDKQLKEMKNTIDELKREMLNLKIEKNSHSIEELIKKALKEK
jgi:integrase